MLTTSTAGSDYSNTVMELRFNPAVNRHVVRVPITQDSITEMDERFRARLMLVQSNGINVQVTPDQAMITIMNGERVTVPCYFLVVLTMMTVSSSWH